MIPMASVASGAPPDEVGNPYTCQAHRVGTFWCQCLACAAAEMQARGYGELHGAELRRALAANRDTIVTNGASGVFDGALAFEQDGRLMILYALTCGRSGAISTDMKFVRHHERTAWLVARARVANREVTRGGQLRPTTAARDRGARSTRSTRATRTAWSAASGSCHHHPVAPDLRAAAPSPPSQNLIPTRMVFVSAIPGGHVR